ncbi:hypothetical protein E5Q_05132 [Mixia osmundae IAM 14324]|uniref:Uncharacterized protein n=1 Tax=Mixia osmundae (strain CBS 9802 / IAM 14324 / JCM 22182 / KY 12970) TaxID=764103 RepID=G7E6I6_MIXOS|nr:hypothetical protein E5Q_05132 [Mixia osmundae IAM 14324]
MASTYPTIQIRSHGQASDPGHSEQQWTVFDQPLEESRR